MQLWKDMGNAFKGKNLKNMSDFWYWGHTHNVIAYSKTDSAAKDCVSRCIGHGAIPYDKGSDFYYEDGSITGLNNPQISYYGGQELPIHRVGEVQLAKNGFAIITLTSSSLTEVFYDEDGIQVYRQVHGF